MKKVYKLYIRFFENFIEYNHYFKMYVAEQYALWRKRKLIKDVKWSHDQQKGFDDFWQLYYKKIKSNGNKLIQSLNGNYNEQYIPDFLYATKIEHQFNSFSHSQIYSDKSLTEILYKGKSKAVLPKTHLVNAGGYYYNEKREVIDKEEALKILNALKEAVVKPTLGGNSGKGVIVDSFDEKGIGLNSRFNLKSLIHNDEKNFIVQEKIIQSEELQNLYPNAVNTFRVITFISQGKVNVSPLSLRIGTGGAKVDNIHAGGLVIGVDEQQENLLELAYKLGYSNQTEKFQAHPNTKIIFKNYKIDGIREIIDAAIILHGFTPNTGIISWDFTINQERNPVLIEANYIGQSMWFSQIANKKTIFNNETINILKSLRK